MISNAIQSFLSNFSYGEGIAEGRKDTPEAQGAADSPCWPLFFKKTAEEFSVKVKKIFDETVLARIKEFSIELPDLTSWKVSQTARLYFLPEVHYDSADLAKNVAFLQAHYNCGRGDTILVEEDSEKPREDLSLIQIKGLKIEKITVRGWDDPSSVNERKQFNEELIKLETAADHLLQGTCSFVELKELLQVAAQVDIAERKAVASYDADALLHCADREAFAKACKIYAAQARSRVCRKFFPSRQLWMSKIIKEELSKTLEGRVFVIAGRDHINIKSVEVAVFVREFFSSLEGITCEIVDHLFGCAIPFFEGFCYTRKLL